MTPQWSHDIDKWHKLKTPWGDKSVYSRLQTWTPDINCPFLLLLSFSKVMNRSTKGACHMEEGFAWINANTSACVKYSDLFWGYTLSDIQGANILQQAPGNCPKNKSINSMFLRMLKFVLRSQTHHDLVHYYSVLWTTGGSMSAIKTEKTLVALGYFHWFQQQSQT